MRMFGAKALQIGSILGFAIAACAPLCGQSLLTGMNAVNPLRASESNQDTLIQQLKSAHVQVVRFGISDITKGLAFARRVNAAGIHINLILSLQYPKDAPSVPYQPKEYPEMWGGHPLSYADTELSRAYFQSILNACDENEIELASLELGNEINWTAFNPEFPLPGEGRIFNHADLSNDPEAKQVAKGYLQYLKVLAVLKEVRDQSKLNRKTPILSAGLADPGPAKAHPGGRDAVTITATIQYLREHGLDKYVDGYGIHTYPGQGTSEARRAAILNNALQNCGTGASGKAKPCWITEWGLDNASTTCPIDDRIRSANAQDVMTIFREQAKAGRLVTAIYYSWDSDPWAKQVSTSSVYRCGAETPTGRATLQR